MGQALLVGLLRSAGSHPGSVRIRELTVTVRSARTAQIIEERISPLLGAPTVPCVQILQQDCNRNVAEQANIVLLGCKHTGLVEVMHGLQGIRHDPRRILVSMMGGVSPNLILETHPEWVGPIVHAVSSIAAEVGESITLLSTNDRHQNYVETQRAVTDLFASVGLVQWLPECQMHAASAIGSSSLAFFAQIIEGLAQGATENLVHADKDTQRLPRDTAMAIAAQAARGAATLLQGSKSSRQLVAQVATKGGATAAGLAVLEKGDVAQTLQDCITTTIVATAGLAPKLDDIAMDTSVA